MGTPHPISTTKSPICDKELPIDKKIIIKVAVWNTPINRCDENTINNLCDSALQSIKSMSLKSYNPLQELNEIAPIIYNKLFHYNALVTVGVAGFMSPY